jgi:Flp pilus assembly protein TadD
LPRLRRLLARLERLRDDGMTRPTRSATASTGAAAAIQAIKVTTRPPLGGAELLLERAQEDEPGEACLHVNRAVLYARHGEGATDPVQAAQAIAWADEHLACACELDPTDAVARLDRAELVAAVGAADGARVLALDLIARIEDGSAVARDDRLLYPLAFSRFGLRWRRELLTGEGATERLTRLALSAAYRLAAEGAEDPTKRIALYERSLECAELPRVRKSLAKVCVAAGRHEDAVGHLERVLATDPLSPAAWKLYVEALARLGRELDARRFIERCRRWTSRISFEDEDLPDQLEQLVARAA